MFYETALILFTIFYGFYASYMDIQTRRISNRLILIGLSFSALTMIGLFVYVAATGAAINSFFVADFFLNFLFSFFAGVIIWLGGLWPAGDAKLFAVYSALIPLSIYKWGYVMHFPAFALLVNTFVPLFIYYIFKIFLVTSWKEKKSVFWEMLDPRYLGESALIVFAFLWLIHNIFDYIGTVTTVFNNVFIVISTLYIILVVFDKLGWNLGKVSAVIGVFELLIDYDTVFSFDYMFEFSYTFIIFILFRYFVIYLGFGVLSRPVFIEELKEGMIPVENIYKKNNRYEKRKLRPTSLVTSLYQNTKEERIFKKVSQGLTKSDIRKLKNLHETKLIKDHHLLISDTLPFAPFLYLGFVLTVLFKGNLLVYLYFLIETFI